MFDVSKKGSDTELVRDEYLQMLSALPERLRKKAHVWKSRHGEKGALERLYNELGVESSEYFKTKFVIVPAPEEAGPFESVGVEVAEASDPYQVEDLPQGDVSDSVKKYEVYRSSFHTTLHTLLPWMILATVYALIFALTSGAMSDTVAEVVGHDNRLAASLGYMVAVVIDLTIFLFIGAVFDKKIRPLHRVVSFLAAALLILSTIASTFITIESHSKEDEISRNLEKISESRSSLEKYQQREREAKAHYYQIVYRSNWKNCMAELTVDCKIRGHRTLEAVNGKSSWDAAKRRLEREEEKLATKLETAPPEDELGIENRKRHRSEGFVVALWILAFAIKWYQASVLPTRISRSES